MSQTPLRHSLAIAGLAGGVFCIDQISKHYFAHLPNKEILHGILATTQHQNYGLLANLAVPMPLILGLTSAVCLTLLFLYKKNSQPKRSFIFALGFILGGALGNMYDRLVHGFVFDWILLFSRSIINIADISIALGILCWILSTRQTNLDQP